MGYLKIIAYIIINLLMVSVIENASDNIIELGLVKRNYNDKVYNNQVFCIQKLFKSIGRVWSTAYVEVKSDQSKCIIYPDIEIANSTISRKRKSSIFNTIVNIIQNFQNQEYNKCHETFYVPLFNKYCFDVEMDGKINVDYVFTYIDYKLVTLLIIGIGLYYSARKLSKFEPFHYFSGVSIGVVGLTLFLLLIMSRFIPKKSIAYLTIGIGSSGYFFFSRWVAYNFWALVESYSYFILCYILFAVLISTLVCYYFGPVTNYKVFNIIEWLIKSISILFIYCGTSYGEASTALIFGFIGANILYKITNLQLFSYFSYRPAFLSKMFPKKRKLLSQDEYVKEGNEYTLKALQELKAYCSSPDCNTWKIVSRIKSPEKFAKFMEKDLHLSDEEVSEYEKYSISRDLIDNDEFNDEFDDDNESNTTNDE